MKIVMLGAPGAGKGTQAKKISDKYKIPHISTGNIFRYNIKKGTELGKIAKDYIDHGQLVPDKIVLEIMVERLKNPDCARGYVLDGFPRTIAQAEALDDTLLDEGSKVDFVIDISVPDADIIARMSGRRACLNCGATYHIVSIPPKKEDICDICGKKLVLRDDDREDTVRKRLEIYHEQTKPLIDYYNDKGTLKTVDGTGSMKEVFDEIIGILEQDG